MLRQSLIVMSLHATKHALKLITEFNGAGLLTAEQHVRAQQAFFCKIANLDLPVGVLLKCKMHTAVLPGLFHYGNRRIEERIDFIG